MRLGDFKEPKPGKLVKTLQGYWAYVPAPLPPSLELSWELAQQISEADRALAQLAGIARTLPNPHLLIGPFVRREAVLSSRIEGSQASLSDLFYFEAAPEITQRVPDVREVRNYVVALEYGLKRLEELPLSLRLVRELHAHLMEGVRGTDRTPGEFRTIQNWIGPPNCLLDEAIYVPPPVPEMHQALDQWEKFLHAPSSFPPLVRVALLHYQFEAIHPFADGNGRVGRLLITLQLCAEGLLPAPFLYLSAYFERHRADYYRRLLAVSQAGAWNDWVRFVLEGVAEQSLDAMQRSDQLHQLRETYRRKLQVRRASALLLQLVDELFSNPVITTGIAMRRLDVTRRSAQLNVEKLVEEGILMEFPGSGRRRTFVAQEIIHAIEDEAMRPSIL